MQGAISHSSDFPALRDLETSFSNAWEGEIRRNIDLGLFGGKLEKSKGDEKDTGLNVNLWYTAVCRIDHGDCPSVKVR